VVLLDHENEIVVGDAVRDVLIKRAPESASDPGCGRDRAFLRMRTRVLIS